MVDVVFLFYSFSIQMGFPDWFIMLSLVLLSLGYYIATLWRWLPLRSMWRANTGLFVSVNPLVLNCSYPLLLSINSPAHSSPHMPVAHFGLLSLLVSNGFSIGSHERFWDAPTYLLFLWPFQRQFKQPLLVCYLLQNWNPQVIGLSICFPTLLAPRCGLLIF